MQLKHFLVVGLIGLSLAGCVVKPQQPPVAANFSYAIPSIASPTKNSMSIAVLAPPKSGWLNTRADLAPVFTSFLDATKVDLERVVVAKGFTSSGMYPSLDEMTYSQKEKSSLILIPTVSMEVVTQRGTLGSPSQATVSGVVRLEFLEPMSKEKVLIKSISLTPITKPVEVALLRRADGKLEVGPNGQAVSDITRNSAVELLNVFYAAAFDKIWAQLDSRELLVAKGDANKIKAKTNYRAN
jgi:hypothetical protein